LAEFSQKPFGLKGKAEGVLAVQGSPGCDAPSYIDPNPDSNIDPNIDPNLI